MPLSAAQDYPLWLNALIFLAAAAAVWSAGTRLVRHLDLVAQRTGMGQAFAGMLLLGTITSLPEVANAITSSSIGNPALAVNNLLGSAAINVLLLAIADAFVGRAALTSRVVQPSTLMQGALCMIVLILVAIAILSGDVLLFGVGAWGLALFATSIAAFWLSAGYERRTPWTLAGDDREGARQSDEQDADDTETSTGRLIAWAALCGAVIFFAGYVLAQTGDALAEQTGLGTGMVGFLLIGISTSMPELSSITAAIRMRRYEMAIGEIFGTNFVNISLILLADVSFAEGPVINELGRFETISALLGAVLTGVYLVGLLERRDPEVMRMGYDSLAVFLLFIGGVGLLFTVG